MRGLSAEVVRRSRNSAPKSQFRGQGIHTEVDFFARFERCVTGKDLMQDHHLNCAIQIITLRDVKLRTQGPKYHH